jgi:cell division septal protein FtsQ
VAEAGKAMKLAIMTAMVFFIVVVVTAMLTRDCSYSFSVSSVLMAGCSNHTQNERQRH